MATKEESRPRTVGGYRRKYDALQKKHESLEGELSGLAHRARAAEYEASELRGAVERYKEARSKLKEDAERDAKERKEALEKKSLDDAELDLLIRVATLDSPHVSLHVSPMMPFGHTQREVGSNITARIHVELRRRGLVD